MERWRTAHDFEEFCGDSGFDDVSDVEFSPDGTLLATGVTPMGGAHAFQVESGERVWSVPASGWSRDPMRVEFDASGTTLRMWGPVHVDARVIAARLGETLVSFPVEWANGLTFSPSGDRLMLGDDVLDARTLELRYQRHEFRDGGYVLIAPSGHYDGTTDAIRDAWVSRDDEPWPLDCFDAILHDPVMVRRAAVGEGTAAAVAAPSLPRPPDLEVHHPSARMAVMDAAGRVVTDDWVAAPIELVSRSPSGIRWFEVERLGATATREEVLRIGDDADPSPERVLEWTIPEAWRGANLELQIRARAVDGTRSKPVLLALAPGGG